jgi:hypothetical protein
MSGAVLPVIIDCSISLRRVTGLQFFSLFIRRGIATVTLVHTYDYDIEVRKMLSSLHGLFAGGVGLARAVR